MEWLQDLERENQRLASEEGFEPLWQAALEAAVSGPADQPDGPLAATPATGQMLMWESEKPTPPEVRLVPDGERQAWRSIAVTALLFAVLLTAWVLSFAPMILGWARTFWPEQLVLLACLGWQTVGLNGIVLLLAVLGVCGRMVVLTFQGLSWLLGPRREES